MAKESPSHRDLTSRVGPNRHRLVLLACTAVVGAACSGVIGGSSATASTEAVDDGPATSAIGSTVTTPPASITTVSVSTPPSPESYQLTAYPVPDGSHPHDVAPALAGGVWYTAQGSGELGLLDPATGATEHIDLGPGSRPHGVITDPSGAVWITDGGLDAIVRVDASTHEVTVFPLLDEHGDAKLNTAAFDENGDLWFTGQSGIVGRLDTSTGAMAVFDAPGGRGPYGITSTPSGSLFFTSLAGSYLGEVATDGSVTVIEPPTPDQGARRVWSASDGALWISEWNSGNVSRYQPATGQWSTWRLPGETPQAYAVYVDEFDVVWLSDFGSNAMLSFDPQTEQFHTYPLPHQSGEVRQIHGRPGEVWGAESAADHLVLISFSD